MPPSDRISQLIQRTRSKLEERFAEFEQNLIAEPVTPSEMTSETTTTPPTFAAPELELEIERLTQELNSEREKNSSLSDSLDHLKDNLRAMGREFQNLKEQYERVSHEKSEIEKIAQRTKELPQVEGLMAELQNCHVKFVEYQTQIQKLKSRRQQLARRCISWKKNQNSRQKNRDIKIAEKSKDQNSIQFALEAQVRQLTQELDLALERAQAWEDQARGVGSLSHEPEN